MPVQNSNSKILRWARIGSLAATYILLKLYSDRLMTRMFEITFTWQSRVSARISKMTVHNSNFKILARPDIATNLPLILIPATMNNLVSRKGQFTCPRRWFVRKILVH